MSDTKTELDQILRLIESETQSLANYGGRPFHTIGNASEQAERIHGMIDAFSIIRNGTRFSDESDSLRINVTDAIRNAFGRLTGVFS